MMANNLLLHRYFLIVCCFLIAFPCWSFFQPKFLASIQRTTGLTPAYQPSSKLYFQEVSDKQIIVPALETPSLVSISPVNIRIASIHDLSAVANLRVAVFYPASRKDVYFQRRLLEKMRHRYDQGSMFLLALRNENSAKLRRSTLLGGSLYGTVEMNSFDFRNTSMENWGSNRKLYVADLAVREDARRLGIATALLRHIEQFAMKNGFEELYLHVEMFNEAARKLYRKHGYFEHPPTVEVNAFTEQHLQRSADSFSLMSKILRSHSPQLSLQ